MRVAFQILASEAFLLYKERHLRSAHHANVVRDEVNFLTHTFPGAEEPSDVWERPWDQQVLICYESDPA